MDQSTTSQERDAAVRSVLEGASQSLKPQQIAEQIAAPWCCPDGYADGRRIAASLKRLGAIRDPDNGFGRYLLPKQ